MQNVEILVNEMQLGNQLAVAVKQNRSNDFGLLLAMMSHNVLDNAEFCLPSESVGADEVDEAALRQQFGLGDKLVYAAKDSSIDQSILLGVDLHSEGLREVKLKGYLTPEPLSLHDDFMHIDPTILKNCEPAVMQRYYKKEDRISQKLEHNPAGLYEVLQSMDVAA
jgi:hypothetical protein